MLRKLCAEEAGQTWRGDKELCADNEVWFWLCGDLSDTW